MNRNKNRKTQSCILPIFGLFLVLLLQGCSDESPAPPFQPVTLISYDEVLTRTKNEIEILISLAGADRIADYMIYDVKVFSITYKTEFQDKEVIASGLVAFPETEVDVPMMSFQHGTITRHSDAPTRDLTLYGLLSNIASAGYIFCIPDFLGFGSSSNILHPYYHAESTGRTIVDILKAAMELSEIMDYSFDGNVFLSGYSEGGYATMATHRMLEEAPDDRLNLIASAPSSGGYDLKGMQEYFFEQEIYLQPYYLAYVALSYKEVYEFEQILTDIFQPEYSQKIPSLLNGTLSGDEINDALTTVMADLLQPEILTGIDTDDRYNYLVDAFELNSLDQWAPQIRMIMYHGTNDLTVPYQNSTDTYNSMIQLGASPDLVTLIPIQDATHDSGIVPYVEEMIIAFGTLK